MLEDGSLGRAAVPSGASTGAHEAVELRDGDDRYLGKGVLKAVAAVNGEIFEASPAWTRRPAAIDKAMIALDGTPNKARSAPTPSSASRWPRQGGGDRPAGLPLYRYVGGANAGCPAGADDEHHQWRRACRQPDRHPGIHDHAGRRRQLADAVRMGAEIFHTLKKELRPAGHNTNVGDEGGFAPNLLRTDEALDFIMKSIEKAGYKPGEDVYLALDAPPPSSSRTASTSWKARASR
jgi:enolase